MAFTDEQKTKRFELENKDEALTRAERVLLAALNDLKEADESGDNIEACEHAVELAEKLVKKEEKGILEEDLDTAIQEIPAGGDDLRRVQANQG